MILSQSHTVLLNSSRLELAKRIGGDDNGIIRCLRTLRYLINWKGVDALIVIILKKMMLHEEDVAGRRDHHEHRWLEKGDLAPF